MTNEGPRLETRMIRVSSPWKVVTTKRVFMSHRITRMSHSFFLIAQLIRPEQILVGSDWIWADSEQIWAELTISDQICSDLTISAQICSDQISCAIRKKERDILVTRCDMKTRFVVTTFHGLETRMIRASSLGPRDVVVGPRSSLIKVYNKKM